MTTTLDEVIFFEKQESRLCAQHALNMLLQGPYFTADVLADIANGLDEQERQMLSGESRDNFQSQNLDDSGFFSIQVITQALSSWDLNLLSIKSPDLTEYEKNPERANAFICNLNEHWFVLRKFHVQWYILDSLKKGPTAISDTYLSLYLNELHSKGYAILYIDGILPSCLADEIAQEIFTLAESLKDVEQPQSSAPSMHQMNEDEEMDMAIALSLSDKTESALIDPSQPLDPNVPSSSKQSSTSHEEAPCSSKQIDEKEMSRTELLRKKREQFLKKFENEE